MDLTFITNNLTLITGMSSAGLVLWVLKKVPNDQIKNIVSTFAEGLGTTLTHGLSKWSATKTLWNSTIEPWFIDLISNTIGAFTEGFIKGLRSDDKKKK